MMAIDKFIKHAIYKFNAIHDNETQLTNKIQGRTIGGDYIFIQRGLNEYKPYPKLRR